MPPSELNMLASEIKAKDARILLEFTRARRTAEILQSYIP